LLVGAGMAASLTVGQWIARHNLAVRRAAAAPAPIVSAAAAPSSAARSPRLPEGRAGHRPSLPGGTVQGLAHQSSTRLAVTLPAGSGGAAAAPGDTRVEAGARRPRHAEPQRRERIDGEPSAAAPEVVVEEPPHAPVAAPAVAPARRPSRGRVIDVAEPF
jgi:hypothetical protein